MLDSMFKALTIAQETPHDRMMNIVQAIFTMGKGVVGIIIVCAIGTLFIALAGFLWWLWLSLGAVAALVGYIYAISNVLKAGLILIGVGVFGKMVDAYYK
jgi:hypothetical protein